MKTYRTFLALTSFAFAGCAADATGVPDEELQSGEEALRIYDPVGDPGGGVVVPPPPPPPSLESIAANYSSYDINGDGVREIESLGFLTGDANNAAATKGMAIVLYDPRLFSDDPSSGVSGLQMRLQLALLRSDMWAEGYNPRFIAASVYRGVLHQDGRTVLALRRFLKAVYANHPLRSVTLIGDFPESTLVRQVLVRGRHTGDARPFGGVNMTNVDYIATGTELVAPRSDLVLGDMDGNWENVYSNPAMSFRDVEIVPEITSGVTWPASGQTLSGVRYNGISQTFQDYFLIADRRTTLVESGGRASLQIHAVAEDGPELSSADRAFANPIARPELEVSRINPRHVALSPRLLGTSVDGQGLLASDGKPRTVRLANQWAGVLWDEDATLERKILSSYLARNHAFRLGNDNAKPYRTSAVKAFESGLRNPVSFNDVLRRADSAFLPSVAVDEAKMADYINWLKTPAVLRGVAAHSDAVSAGYAASDPWLVNAMVGGRPWFWNLKSDAAGYFLEPDLGDRASADFFLYRTIWENKVLDYSSTGQAFFMHFGCSVNGVWPVDQRYNAVLYSERQHAESMLFFANGLGMVARGKVFNDMPRNFTETMASTKRFASGLKGYFAADAADANLNPSETSDWLARRERTLQRKRTYFWGLLGDPTLRIRY